MKCKPTYNHENFRHSKLTSTCEQPQKSSDVITLSIYTASPASSSRTNFKFEYVKGELGNSARRACLLNQLMT